MFEHIQVPEDGTPIYFDNENNLVVPNNPIIPFIQGDGIGPVSYTHLTLPTILLV